MTEVSNVTNTILTTLDIGSGVDTVKLARDLTDAVKIPQENKIQEKIDGSEASITAYGLVKVAVTSLKMSFESLNDASELSTSSGSSSDVSKMTVSAVNGSAKAGSYDFKINQLAQNQRVTSDQYTSKTQSLNSGSAFNISLAVGTTKSAVSAIYNATATPSETTTLVVGDGTTTVSVASASYNSIADQVTAITNGTGYNSLLFTAHVNSAGNGIEFRYKSSGSVASTPTFTGTGSSHTITNPTVGVSVATPVTGVAAKYTVTGVAAETTDLVVSDGTTAVSIASATYTSIAQQVTAIQAGAGYDNLNFTVSSNASNDGFVFQYKTTGAITTAPTLTGTGSTHTVGNPIVGVTAVNAATTTSISVNTDTPAGVVSAINAANTGVTATLVNTGTASNTFKIILAGESGSNGIFNLTSTPDLGFHDTANLLQSAQDSVVEFDGLTLTRSSNQLSDVVEGATINLMAVSSGNVSLTLNNDTSALKTSIKNLVATYNDALVLFDSFTSVESADVELSGALADDVSMIRYLKDKIFSAVFTDSSTPAGSISGLRSIGVTVDQYGTIQLDENKYDARVLDSYPDIVTMLTADTSNQVIYGSTKQGLSQDVATLLEGFVDTNGLVTLREQTTKIELSDHKEALVKLEKRMDVIYNRYLSQFGAMETLMVTLDSTKDYLTAQFKTLSKAYDTD